MATGVDMTASRLSDLANSGAICLVGAHSGGDLCARAVKSISDAPLYYVRSPLQTDSMCSVSAKMLPSLEAASSKVDAYVCTSIEWVKEARFLLEFGIPAEKIFPPVTPHTLMHFKTPDQWRFMGDEIIDQFDDTESKLYWASLEKFFGRMDPFEVLENRNKRGRYGYAHKAFENLKGMTALDVGAWIGDDSQEFIDYGCSKVHSIEPTLGSFSTLAGNGKSEVVPRQVAAGNYNGIGFISAHQYTSWNGLGGDLNGEQIRVETLDATDWGDLGIIKLEPEGADIDVLLGSIETLKKHKPILCITAYHDPFHAYRILNIARNILPRGYKVFVAPKYGYSWQLYFTFIWE
jgi:FkbM family methyltransferase